MALTSLENAVNAQGEQNTDFGENGGENASPERIYVHNSNLLNYYSSLLATNKQQAANPIKADMGTIQSKCNGFICLSPNSLMCQSSV
jgi:hypothetical protein